MHIRDLHAQEAMSRIAQPARVIPFDHFQVISLKKQAIDLRR